MKNQWKLIVMKGFPPTRLVRYCCEYQREGGEKGNALFYELKGQTLTQKQYPCTRGNNAVGYFYAKPGTKTKKNAKKSGL